MRGDLKIYFLGWRGLNLGGDLEVHVEAGTINDTTSVVKKISFNVTYPTIQFNYILLNLVQAKLHSFKFGAG